MVFGDPVCTRCACRFTSCACIDDRVAAEMRAIQEPSEMVRLVPEGRAERQVAAVREAFEAWDPEESPGHYDAIRRALETE